MVVLLTSQQLYEFANELDQIKKEKEKLQEELNNQKFKEVYFNLTNTVQDRRILSFFGSELKRDLNDIRTNYIMKVLVLRY